VPIADVSDVRARYEAPVSTADEPRVAQLLADAELRLRAEVPDLDERIANGKPSEDLVVLALCDMVIRLLRNPGGYSSQTVGSLSYSVTAAGPGRVEVTAAERVLLGIRRGGTTIPLADANLRRPYGRPPGVAGPSFDPFVRRGS
jgi:hypothetical protein